MYTFKKRTISSTIEAQRALGIAIGSDSYKYKHKKRTSYHVMFLCFIITVTVTKFSDVPKNSLVTEL